MKPVSKNTRIGQYCHREGITLADLAERSGLSKDKLSKINRGVSTPSRDEAFAIQDATDCFVDARSCPGVNTETPTEKD